MAFYKITGVKYMGMGESLGGGVSFISENTLNRYQLYIPSCKSVLDVISFNGTEEMSSLYRYVVHFSGQDSGRNNRQVDMKSGDVIKQKELDAINLEAAVNANWDANAECLKNDYGVSNEKLEEIRVRLHELNRQTGLY